MRYYSTADITHAAGITYRTLSRYIKGNKLEEKLGLTCIKDSLTGHRLFSEDAVRNFFEHYVSKYTNS